MLTKEVILSKLAIIEVATYQNQRNCDCNCYPFFPKKGINSNVSVTRSGRLPGGADISFTR